MLHPLKSLLIVVVVLLFSGCHGTPGRDGRDGRDGVKGDKGDIGQQGEKGEQGLTWVLGPNGGRGIAGRQGPLGLQGPMGTSGEKGDRGVPGLYGPQGTHGPVGQKGEKGTWVHGFPGDSGVKGEKGSQGDQGPPSIMGGVVYVRWGRTSCPTGNGSELVYSGRAGGSNYEHFGGGANIICMPNDPEYDESATGTQGFSYVYGIEYQSTTHQPTYSVDNENVPCAVCYVSTRHTVLVIPARMHCHANWTTEYTGYLMAGYYNHNGRTTYECIDKSPDTISGLESYNRKSAFLYHVEAECTGLSCPPYDAGKEITCVVCTR